MTETYNILSIFVTGGLFFGLGLVLLLSGASDSPLLGNYRRARYALAGAYLFFVAVEAAKFLSGGQSVPLLQTVTLTIAASQAFLFTFAMLALLETRFPGWKAIFRESIPAILLIAATAIVYAACPETTFRTAFYVFWGIYLLLLIRYTALFVRNYKRFRRRMNDFYSGNEADRLRWVAVSFGAALLIGIGAFLTSVFMSTVVALIFTIFFDIFYIFFAIRFIKYASHFHTIEAAMKHSLTEEETVPEETILPEIVQSDHAAITAVNGKTVDLERRLDEWVAAKGYTERNVTVDMLVLRLGTNYHYLSAHINTHKGKHFNQWVNELRIGEAKRLLAECPDMTISEIAFKVGFVNKSHFGKIFLALTKSTPKVWRNSSSDRD